MQQTTYNKISLAQLGLVVFCTIIAALVLMFFLIPMMQFGGGPFEMGAPPTIPDDVFEEIREEILTKESVKTFKETFPDFREDIKQRYGVEYQLQARNPNTGNVLSLDIGYHPMGPPGSTDQFDSRENLRCIPSKNLVMNQEGFFHMMHGNDGGLFIHESIKSTNCLDDDWKADMLTVDELN